MSWNRPAATPQNEQKKPSAKPTLKHGIIAGAAVVVLGLAALWIFSGGDATPKAKGEKKTGTIKEVKSAKGAHSEKVAFRGSEAGERTVVDAVTQTKAPTNEVSGEALPPPTFKKITDQHLVMLLNPNSGPIPPFPPGVDVIPDKEFLESLKTPIIINDDDPENVKALKEKMIVARQEVKEAIDSGMSFGQVLNEYRDNFNENLKIQGQIREELDKIIESGDLAEARKYRTVMNLALQQMGIGEVDTPITEEEIAAAKERDREMRHQRAEEVRARKRAARAAAAGAAAPGAEVR